MVVVLVTAGEEVVDNSGAGVVVVFWPGGSVRKVLHGPDDREGLGRGIQVCSAARRQHPFVGGRGHHWVGSQ